MDKGNVVTFVFMAQSLKMFCNKLWVSASANFPNIRYCLYPRARNLCVTAVLAYGFDCIILISPETFLNH
jgi:hypothetical protein